MRLNPDKFMDEEERIILGLWDKSYYTACYKHCGKNWEIMCDEIGPDVCACVTWTDPVYYVVEDVDIIEENDPLWGWPRDTFDLY
jgi:hypothetical protein